MKNENSEKGKIYAWIFVIGLILAVFGSCNDQSNEHKSSIYPSSHEEYIREQNNKWARDVKENLRRQGYGN